MFAIPLGRTGQIFNDYSNDRQAALLSPGTVLTAAAITSSGTNAEATFVANIVERI